jgi:hypothetical protein
MRLTNFFKQHRKVKYFYIDDAIATNKTIQDNQVTDTNTTTNKTNTIDEDCDHTRIGEK